MFDKHKEGTQHHKKLGTRELKTTMVYHYSSIKYLTLKRMKTPNAGEDAMQLEFTCIDGQTR